MSQLPDAIWINVSPSLRRFHRPLLKLLSRHVTLAEWQYNQTEDEPTSLTIALGLLHDYIERYNRPLHLLGHGTGGLLASLYARHYPERVKSLCLLSVGAYPAIDWQAHYYVQLGLLPCSRDRVLTQTAHNLFGSHSPPVIEEFVRILEKDLRTSLSPHSLYRRVNLFPSEFSAPVWIGRGEKDVVIDPNLFYGWEPWIGDGDRLWECPHGRYFFHHTYPQLVKRQILNFWKSLQHQAREDKQLGIPNSLACGQFEN